MAEQTYTSAYYRQQAENARQSAARATKVEYREGYLKLAATWDRLADEMDKSRAGDAEAIAQLMRSIPKA